MNANDVLRYGHATVARSVEGVPDWLWLEPGACGTWSIKDIVAHLASFEHMLVDVLASLDGDGPTPTLERFLTTGATWNDDEVARRADLSPGEALAEYEQACADALARLAALPPERLRQAGALAWYGAEYDVEDYLVYTFYGHKREHTGQIDVYRDRRLAEAGDEARRG